MTSTLYDTAAELSATAADLAAAIDTGEPTGPLASRAADLAAGLAAVLGTGPPGEPADLAQIARQLQQDLRANRRPAITDANQLDVQALCVAEEAGELVGAYRRWAGKARRTGTLADLEDEVADVLIVTAVFAERAGIDINDVITRKLTRIYRRGWRAGDTPAATSRPGYDPNHEPGLPECGCRMCNPGRYEDTPGSAA
jgi:NTP pyrophosphatase (non-canonical NTP hydrolase)